MVGAVEFRDGMARFVEAVTIVATDGPAGSAGLTATSVASVSDAPPTLLVCLNRSGRSHAAICGNGAFCVSLLAADQRETARAFARIDAPAEARFALAAWERLATGAPALAGALVALDCRLVDAKAVGTHVVLFGEVVAIARGPSRPALLYAERDWRTIDLGTLGPSA